MDMAHGFHGEPWCRHCILFRQLEYAQERAEKIPALKEKLADLELKEANV